MPWKHLKSGLRNLQRHAGYTAINVVGLALGIAACLLIALYVRHELSYDDFHDDAEQIHRVTFTADLSNIRAPLSPAPIAQTLVKEFPAVEGATRVGIEESATVEVGNQSFRENQILTADSSFFDLFSGFSFRHGHSETALATPDAAVLTASTTRSSQRRADNFLHRCVLGDSRW